jgi:hypothetical protein
LRAMTDETVWAFFGGICIGLVIGVIAGGVA